MRTGSNTPLFRTSITPEGKFLVGLHRPSFSVVNLRQEDRQGLLGHTAEGDPCDNRANFPEGDVCIDAGKPIYEIPNAFPFRGTTYIDSDWAEARAKNPSSIGLPPPRECSLRQALRNNLQGTDYRSLIPQLPIQVLYSLAATSTDAEELIQMAETCCRIEHDTDGRPTGLLYRRDATGALRAEIDDFELFETVANNPHLPDAYKEVMVLRPGVQGGSEIVGEWAESGSHVVEYLRSNSYIPGGHYASNMASDAIRYRTSDLSSEDIRGLRHLYYQRTYVALAGQLGIPLPVRRRRLSADELDSLRLQILQSPGAAGNHPATLWGWNFGYDFSASGYRLHASHQMIHQQYAMTPETVTTMDGSRTLPSYSCGDLVADTVTRYGEATGSDFFPDFLSAIRRNVRTDGRNGEKDLTVWEDENVLLFVPKAQVSQWELQALVIADADGRPVGNVVEADQGVRRSIDLAILIAQKIFAGLGARMVTSIEFPKRVGLENGQRLLYSFLPKLPWSMGAFSEAQLRYISGHYPEDFAACCRLQLTMK